MEKSIKKEEQKQAAKDYISDLSKGASSPSAVWSLPKRPSSAQGAGHVRKAGYSPSLKSIASGESEARTQAPSEASSDTKAKQKYAAKGKETSAPRGRGGGVPVKTADKERGRQTPLPELYGSSRSMRASSSNISRTARSTGARDSGWAKYKIWTGPGHSQPYKGLEDVRLPPRLHRGKKTWLTLYRTRTCG